ncbi:cysteine rich repeat-containing protein [Bradyrhizobium yuanmingense]|uniref:cysteine rich repeat-containing protein n=1 Tax=Bradyrhizobium yuanmingense TaxID=108015 RepID=UPI0023B96C15|nr:cysteine rich repeat-containing protein [Bradyrhizobium yuanmingense]MDF0578118.1 cysteine rich repeat-containing protein [Bradyrhizobium yuanmingense]
MFNTLKHASTRTALLATALFATATGAFAQTEAQKSAIRSACRSDFMAHCSSVTPGGVEAYQCLAKNMSSLSSGCQTAVRAVEPAAAPKTEAAPAKSEPAKSEPAKSEPAKSEPAKTEAAPAAAPASKPGAAAAPKAAAAKQPSPAQVSAIKSACRGDYPKVCASVPPGGAPALECLEKNKAKVSAGCAKAVNAAFGGGAAAPASAAAPAAEAAPAAAPAAIVLRPLLPREELFIVRSACGADIRTLCTGVAPGGGRIIQCISNRAASLSPACKEVLAPFAAR